MLVLIALICKYSRNAKLGKIRISTVNEHGRKYIEKSGRGKKKENRERNNRR
jgi:hypothetical protein